MKRDADSDITLLHAAADPTRLSILRELSSESSVCACDFTECCGTVSQPTVSHHLKVLREAGWVSAERHGTNVSYTICADAVERFRHIAAGLRPAGARPASAMLFPVVRMRSTTRSPGGTR
jgi:ArsR family transcriptional regulator